jgi:hypothetical protein
MSGHSEIYVALNDPLGSLGSMSNGKMISKK